jgi:hypothetical protein
MSYETTVLSLNPDRKALLRMELALRDSGFKVISVGTPLYARFEIEMGTCGIFMICYVTPPIIHSNLAALFRRTCSDGLIVFLAQTAGDTSPEADIVISDNDDPQAAIERLRGGKAQSKAS